MTELSTNSGLTKMKLYLLSRKYYIYIYFEKSITLLNFSNSVQAKYMYTKHSVKDTLERVNQYLSKRKY